MAENKRYYWLKLDENFFEDDTIEWLEEQENGKDYVIFYLKLCLRSLKDDGKLIRYVGQTLIPYDVKALAKLTNTDSDTVRVAMNVFKQIGLIEILETGEIYLTQVSEMTGSETDSARRMRKKRLIEDRKKAIESNTVTLCNNVQKCDTEIEIEKEKELDIEIDNKEQKKESKKDINEFFEKIWKLYPNKRGKGQVSNTKKKKLYELGYDTIKKCIDRYLKDLEKDKDWRKPQNGSTFFNSGYVDYLDENYKGVDDEPREDSERPREKSLNELIAEELERQGRTEL